MHTTTAGFRSVVAADTAETSEVVASCLTRRPTTSRTMPGGSQAKTRRTRGSPRALADLAPRFHLRCPPPTLFVAKGGSNRSPALRNLLLKCYLRRSAIRGVGRTQSFCHPAPCNVLRRHKPDTTLAACSPPPHTLACAPLMRYAHVLGGAFQASSSEQQASMRPSVGPIGGGAEERELGTLKSRGRRSAADEERHNGRRGLRRARECDCVPLCISASMREAELPLRPKSGGWGPTRSRQEPFSSLQGKAKLAAHLDTDLAHPNNTCRLRRRLRGGCLRRITAQKHGDSGKN